jgi:cytochrome b6-f complex iron-sulfur subunit
MIDENNQKAGEPSRQRRSFLTRLWFWLAAAALAEVFYLITAFLRPRKQDARGGQFGAVIEAGAVDGFKAGSVTAFPRGQFYLSRLADGGFLAISRTCTHLGCTVPWEEKDKQFACPCHGSLFDSSGSVMSSPAPRALDIFAVFIENNIVKVDTSARIKRSAFNQSQVVYPKKI